MFVVDIGYSPSHIIKCVRRCRCLGLTHLHLPVAGQPIVVSNVSKHMRVKELWTPKAFSKSFGHIRHDLIDCRRNEPLNGYQIKCFWDGFEDQTSESYDYDTITNDGEFALSVPSALVVDFALDTLWVLHYLVSCSYQNEVA